MTAELGSHKRKLSFGILCRSLELCRWEIDCIRRILDTGVAELKLVVLDDNAYPNRIRSTDRTQLGFRLFKKLLVDSRSKAMRKERLEYEQGAVTVISCKTRNPNRFTQYFQQQDTEKIKSLRLDFLLRFGFKIIRGEILKVARWGVWSFHHGDENSYRGVPPCFWEIYQGDPVSGAILQQLTDKLDGGIVLYKGYFKTVDYSYRLNRERAYWESAKWPGVLCRELAAGHEGRFSQLPSQTAAAIRRAPDNKIFVRFLGLLLRNKIRRTLEFVFSYDLWKIGLIRLEPQTLLNGRLEGEVQWVGNPRPLQFYADPFAFRDSDGLRIFVESCDHLSRGVIRELEFKEETMSAREVATLDLPVHASYPFTLEEGGRRMIIPETYKASKVFVCVEGENGWEIGRTLFDGLRVSDPTIFKYLDKYWCFCSGIDGDANNNLHIYVSNTLDGPWRPHLGNPVKTDVRSSCPAGAFFKLNGSWYRPAQDCSQTYGGSIVLSKVLELTEERYREEEICRISPDKAWDYKDGLHTLNLVEPYALFDAKMIKWSWMGPFVKLVRKLRNTFRG